MRSSFKERSASRALVNVVLPDDVPPAMRILAWLLMASFNASASAGASAPWSRGRDREEKPFEPLAAEGEFGRDDGGGAVCGFSHPGGDQENNALAVGGGKCMVGYGETDPGFFNPDRAVGVGHDFNCVRSIKRLANHRAERCAQHCAATGVCF